MQPTLNLKLHQRTALVTVETARSVKGVDAQTILGMIDTGELPFAFNIATQNAVREIRLWARDLIAPDARIPLSTAIEAIIGTARPQLRAGEVAHILVCHGATIMRMVDLGLLSGPLVGHTRHITRESLASFLYQRHLS